MNGIGGDLFALVWHADSERLYALNATGRAPHAISRETLVRQGYERMPGNGPLTWTVPGAVDGWQQLLDRFGTLELADVLAPAIGYARGGFAVTDIIAGQWNAAAPALAEWPDSAATYLPGGRALLAGEVFRNPRLAATYEALAAGGRDAFYRGRHRAAHRRVQRGERRLLHVARLRGPHVRLAGAGQHELPRL